MSAAMAGEGNGNPPQYSCLENPRDGSLVGCCLWGHTESDTTEVTQQQPQLRLQLLWLLCKPGENKCVCNSYGSSVSSSSFFAPALPILGSANSADSVNNKIFVIRNGVRNTMGFSRQESWSGLPFTPPGNLPDPGIEPVFLVSLALPADSLLAEPQGKPY